MSPRGKSAHEKEIDQYNDFIRQIEIVNFRLISAKIDSYRSYSALPANNKIVTRSKAWFEIKDESFDVCQQYTVTVRDTDAKKLAAKLSVTFCVTYSSTIAINDEYFSIFKERNLPINTWPYFREFVHDSFARMGWTAIIAPTHKG